RLKDYHGGSREGLLMYEMRGARKQNWAILATVSAVVVAMFVYWMGLVGHTQYGQSNSNVVVQDGFANVYMAAFRVMTSGTLALVESPDAIVAYDISRTTPILKGRIADGAQRTILGTVESDLIADVNPSPYGDPPTSTIIERVSFGATPQRVFLINLPGLSLDSPVVDGDQFYRVIRKDGETESTLEVYAITALGLSLEHTIAGISTTRLAVSGGYIYGYDYLAGTDQSAPPIAMRVEVMTKDDANGPTIHGSLTVSGDFMGVMASGSNIFLYGTSIVRVNAVNADRPVVAPGEALACGELTDLSIDGERLVGVEHVEAAGSDPMTRFVVAELHEGALPRSCASATIAGRYKGIWASGGKIWAAGDGVEAFEFREQGGQGVVEPAFDPKAARGNLVAARAVGSHRLAAYDYYHGLTLYETAPSGATARVAVLPSLAGRWFVAIAATDNAVYMVTEDTLTAINTATYNNPTVAGSIPNKCRLPGQTKITADHLFIRCGGRGITMFDISRPLAPAFVGAVAEGDDEGSFDLLDHLLYSFVGQRILRIYNVADIRTPTLLGELPLSGALRYINVTAGFAYITGYDWVLTVVDVRNPSQPTLAFSASRIQETNRSNVIGSIIVGEWLLLSTDGGGTAVVHVSPNLAPRLKTFWAQPGELNGLSVGPGTTISGVFGAGAVVIDAADAMNPVRVMTVRSPG
ncbi:MAG: hypothetical protein ABI780_12785, partial [Ardenticatenales bacterium]